jgi:hypothetical protein
MIAIFQLAFSILLKLLPVFIKKIETQQEIKNKIMTAFKQYEAEANQSATLRTQQQEMDEALKQEWEKQFKEDPIKPIPDPSRPQPLYALDLPVTIKANENFTIQVVAPIGTELYVDTYKLLDIGTQTSIPLMLNTTGKRVFKLIYKDDVLVQKEATVI